MTRSRKGAELLTAYESGSLSFKNRIINGAMVIDQRNAGASVTPANGQYVLDRWRNGAGAASKFSVQQVSTTTISGFSYCMKATSLSAYSVAAGDLCLIQQYIEGYNIADFNFGTANASTVTLSFYVYSSLSGAFGGSLQNSDRSRCYPFTYTINAANTWERKSITISGDTVGTWLATNGIGMQLNFGVGVGSTYLGAAGSWSGSTYFSATGSTNLVGTNGATFYITGVQLEKGSTATSFDYRPYGTELALCQRYFQIVKALQGIGFGATIFMNPQFPVVMRATPTFSLSGVMDFTVPGVSSHTQTTASVSQTGAAGPYNAFLQMNNFSPSAPSGVPLFVNANTNSLLLNAEL